MNDNDNIVDLASRVRDKVAKETQAKDAQGVSTDEDILPTYTVGVNVNGAAEYVEVEGKLSLTPVGLAFADTDGTFLSFFPYGQVIYVIPILDCEIVEDSAE